MLAIKVRCWSEGEEKLRPIDETRALVSMGGYVTRQFMTAYPLVFGPRFAIDYNETNCSALSPETIHATSLTRTPRSLCL
jgi:hypothetical protein